ncbi:biotin transporter BioY [Spirochaeta dissipatitropha]
MHSSFSSSEAAADIRIRRLVMAAFFSAAIAAGSYMSIPLGPVPFTLQTMFVILCGLILKPLWSLTALSAYLLMGTIGLPVFSAGSGGIGHLLGPTGGYILSFLPAAILASLLSSIGADKPSKARGIVVVQNTAAGIAASAVIYTGGVLRLAQVTGMELTQAVNAGMMPFLLGDALKIAAAVSCAALMRPILKRWSI